MCVNVEVSPAELMYLYIMSFELEFFKFLSLMEVKNMTNLAANIAVSRVGSLHANLSSWQAHLMRIYYVIIHMIVIICSIIYI